MLEKKERSIINNLSFHLMELEKEEQFMLQISRRKDIVKN
jgi:hypothetical protein